LLIRNQWNTVYATSPVLLFWQLTYHYQYHPHSSDHKCFAMHGLSYWCYVAIINSPSVALLFKLHIALLWMMSAEHALLADRCVHNKLSCTFFWWFHTMSSRKLLSFRGPSTALWKVWRHIWLHCFFGLGNWALKRIWLCHVFWHFCCWSGSEFLCLLC